MVTDRGSRGRKRTRAPLSPSAASHILPPCLVGSPTLGRESGSGARLCFASRCGSWKVYAAVGIHGDPIAAKKRIAHADRIGERLGKDAYGYPRAFTWSPDAADRAWMDFNGLSEKLVVLDPTAGGGAIPFETARLGATALSNDLNPVAALIEKATIDYPLRHGAALRPAFDDLAKVFISKVRERLQGVYPAESDEDIKPDGYLWTRTIHCPY